MTVEQYIDSYFKTNKSAKVIRMMDAVTRRGIGKHWIQFSDFYVIDVKVTDKYLFIYI